MTSAEQGQYPLPIEIEVLFEEDAALKLHKVSEYFRLEPRQLAMYGLGLLLTLKEESEKTDQEYAICLVGKKDSREINIESPQEAAAEGKL